MTGRSCQVERNPWWSKAATHAARSSALAAAHPQPQAAVHTCRASSATSGQFGHQANWTPTGMGVARCRWGWATGALPGAPTPGNGHVFGALAAAPIADHGADAGHAAASCSSVPARPAAAMIRRAQPMAASAVARTRSLSPPAQLAT